MTEKSGAAESIEAEDTNKEIDPSEASTAEATDESGKVTSEKPETQDEEQEESGKNYTQKELDEIVQKRLARQSRKESRKIAKLEGMLEAIQAGMAPKDVPGADEEEGQLSVAQLKAQLKAELAEERQREEYQRKIDKTFQQAMKEDSGFDLEAFEDVPITREMAEAITDSDISHKLVLYFDKNPDEAERIAELSPRGQIREIGRLEERLLAKPAAPKVKTGASKPIDPVGKGADKGEAVLRPGLSPEDWIRNRRKVYAEG